MLARVDAAATMARAAHGRLPGRGEAQASRGTGPGDPELWAEAAAAWERLERPYPVAIALWRRAEALMAAGDRDARGGGRPARPRRSRKELGSEWLAAELDGSPPAAASRWPSTKAREQRRRRAPDAFGLTERERQVLTLLTRGATNREIGAELYMAEKTASVHVSRILAKLGVRRRTEAAAVAHRHGLDGD